MPRLWIALLSRHVLDRAAGAVAGRVSEHDALRRRARAGLPTAVRGSADSPRRRPLPPGPEGLETFGLAGHVDGLLECLAYLFPGLPLAPAFEAAILARLAGLPFRHQSVGEDRKRHRLGADGLDRTSVGSGKSVSTRVKSSG